MSTDLARPSPPGVARHLLGWQLVGLEVLLGAFVAAVALAGLGIHAFFEVTGSIWSGGVQVMRWFAIGMGVYLTAVFLPVYLAHGRTRREFAAGAAAFTAVLAVWLSAAVLLVYALEAGLYHLIGWAELLPEPHPVGSPSQIVTSFGQHGAAFLAWTAAGALGGAAFYRATRLGVVIVPLCLAMIGAAEPVVRPTEVPDSWGIVTTVAQAAPAAGIALAVTASVLGAALTWFIVRDIPMRPTPP